MTALTISDLVLSHFRSHKAAQIRFDGRPVAVYGPNGAGKTNILEAVSLLSPGRGLRRASGEELSRQPEALGWKIRARINGFGPTHEVETWAEPGQSRQVRIDDKAAQQVALARVTRLVWLVPSMDRLWIEAAEGRRRFLDRMTLSFVPDHAQAVLTYEKAMRDRNRLLRDQVRDDHWYSALESQMAEAGAQIVENRNLALARLQAAQNDAETAFPRADLALISAQEEGDTPDLATALAQSRRRDMAAGRSLVGPHRADLAATFAPKAMPAAQCSTGEQKALLISLILANARAIASDLGAAPILLLDEVAAHLDASRRRALYDELAALRAQAIMTGTGAELFETLGQRAQYFEITDDMGRSVIREGQP